MDAGWTDDVIADRVNWEQRVSDAWASADQRNEEELLALIENLAAELPPDSSIGIFERAASLDSTGHSDLAVPLYRQALDLGLTDERRRRAVIQLASSLRNLGQPEASVALLTAELDAGSDHLDDAVRAFLALALVDTGREREAVSLALTALAPHLPRYQRSLANYARQVSDETPAVRDSRGQWGRDSEADHSFAALCEQQEEIETREDFVRFAHALQADLRDHPASWENPSLESYLEALEAVANSIGQGFKNRGLSLPDQPTWRIIADILLTARIYE